MRQMKREMVPQEQLNNHLKQMAEFFKEPMCPLERFVLECGQDFQGMKRPKYIKKQKDKMCFSNATHLSIEQGLDYVEGFAVHNGLIPIFHAWCVTSTGDVIDNTWRFPENSVYRGVIIPKQIRDREILKHEVYGVLDFGFGINTKVIEELREQFLCRV